MLGSLDAKLSVWCRSDAHADTPASVEELINTTIEGLVAKLIFLEETRTSAGDITKMGPDTFRGHYNKVTSIEKDIERQKEEIHGYAKQLKTLLGVQNDSDEDIVFKKSIRNEALLKEIEGFEQEQTDLLKSKVREMVESGSTDGVESLTDAAKKELVQTSVWKNLDTAILRNSGQIQRNRSEMFRKINTRLQQPKDKRRVFWEMTPSDREAYLITLYPSLLSPNEAIAHGSWLQTIEFYKQQLQV